MPKVTMTFNLPEEKVELLIAQQGIDYYCALDELQRYRRQLYKYDERENVPKDEIIAKLDEILYDVTLDHG
jgi:hypothetical protein